MSFLCRGFSEIDTKLFFRGSLIAYDFEEAISKLESCKNRCKKSRSCKTVQLDL